MANTLLTSTLITRRSMDSLENNLAFAKQVRRDFDDQFGVVGRKSGYLLNIRKPPRAVTRVGQAADIQSVTENYASLVLNRQWGADLELSSADLTLAVDDFQERIIEPFMAQVANTIDLEGMLLYKDIFNSVGTPGTPATTTTLDLYASAKQKLIEGACPIVNLAVVINAMMERYVVVNNAVLLNPPKEISEQYISGTMGKALGFKFSTSANCPMHTVGDFAGTIRVMGAGQTGNSLLIDAVTSGKGFKRGDIFTIGSTVADYVYAVNPQSRMSTGSLQQFVVLADATAGASTELTLQIAPPLEFSGGPQTVTSSTGALADNGLITVSGTAALNTPQGLAFAPSAFVLGCADLEMPKNIDMSGRAKSPRLNVSMRFTRTWDANQDRFIARLDVLGGWATLYRELACRIQQ